MEERISPWEAASVARSFRKRRDVNHISRHFAPRCATKSAENHLGQPSTANDRVLIKLLLLELVSARNYQFIPVPSWLELLLSRERVLYLKVSTSCEKSSL
ncbi:hypothetical protein NPIL_352321 [Nephila pilipes]|uniref:Uncharacterized protein n=1 Tax=Nephila pilipes TaxID=299642 RepID=A0A8X6R457_NEPPI|nr:hypothetical protein NPIL_352321 [Nephila pilipes]